jgi:hypothetical protein
MRDYSDPLSKEDRRMFELVAPLAFGHYAWVRDRVQAPVEEAGSGILVAPRLGLSAAHVSRGFERLDERIEAARRRFGPLEPQYARHPIEPEYSTMVFQIPEAEDQRVEWAVDVDWQSPDTDITTLQVLPESEVAKARDTAGLTYFDWQLLPPPVGATVRIYGWPRPKIENDAGREHRQNIEFWGDGAMVVEQFYPIRDHGMTNFAGFRLDRMFDHGFSGGPVFFDNALVGIFSGPDIVGSLWPLALMTYPDRAKVEHSFADDFDSGLVRARDWDQVKDRVDRWECEEALQGSAVESRCAKKHAVLRR